MKKGPAFDFKELQKERERGKIEEDGNDLSEILEGVNMLGGLISRSFEQRKNALTLEIAAHEAFASAIKMANPAMEAAAAASSLGEDWRELEESLGKMKRNRIEAIHREDDAFGKKASELVGLVGQSTQKILADAHAKAEKLKEDICRLDAIHLLSPQDKLNLALNNQPRLALKKRPEEGELGIEKRLLGLKELDASSERQEEKRKFMALEEVLCNVCLFEFLPQEIVEHQLGALWHAKENLLISEYQYELHYALRMDRVPARLQFSIDDSASILEKASPALVGERLHRECTQKQTEKQAEAKQQRDTVQIWENTERTIRAQEAIQGADATTAMLEKIVPERARAEVLAVRFEQHATRYNRACTALRQRLHALDTDKQKAMDENYEREITEEGREHVRPCATHGEDCGLEREDCSWSPVHSVSEELKDWPAAKKIKESQHAPILQYFGFRKQHVEKAGEALSGGVPIVSVGADQKAEKVSALLQFLLKKAEEDNGNQGKAKGLLQTLNEGMVPIPISRIMEAFLEEKESPWQREPQEADGRHFVAKVGELHSEVAHTLYERDKDGSFSSFSTSSDQHCFFRAIDQSAEKLESLLNDYWRIRKGNVVKPCGLMGTELRAAFVQKAQGEVMERHDVLIKNIEHETVMDEYIGKKRKLEKFEKVKRKEKIDAARDERCQALDTLRELFGRYPEEAIFVVGRGYLIDTKKCETPSMQGARESLLAGSSSLFFSLPPPPSFGKALRDSVSLSSSVTSRADGASVAFVEEDSEKDKKRKTKAVAQ